jgi:DNA repair exonuclease SbcCD nuclease subunit
VRPLRFLQISDVHFGAPMRGGRLRLDDDTARTRARERRAAFARAFEMVHERDLDGVLIPGDLFDDESIDTDTLRFVVHTMQGIAPRPVFVAPGNHDPYGGASPYRTVGQEDARGVRWPDNVHVFAHAEFRTIAWPGRDGVFVTGSGVAANAPDTTRRLARRVPREGEGRHLLLFHGSRDDGHFLQAHKSTHPFSRDELLAQDFDWVALGHYHQRDVIVDDEGRARAAYGGCLIAGGLDERADRGALVVELDAGSTNVEAIPLDPREVHAVELDVTGADFAEDLVARLDATLEGAGVGAQDLVLVRAHGRRARGVDLRVLTERAAEVFHLRVDASGVRAAVDPAEFPPLEDAVTTEERFVATLRDDPPADVPEERVHRALLYGLDALERGRLDARYEE